MSDLTAPLVAKQRSTEVPATWCVIECCLGCKETWTVDVADFTPPLTSADVERLMTPVLLEHEQAHEGAWR